MSVHGSKSSALAYKLIMGTGISALERRNYSSLHSEYILYFPFDFVVILVFTYIIIFIL